jgi:GTP-binding protein Era
VKIDQVIHVAREGHRPIVLGKGGATVRDVGAAARAELIEIFGRQVHLFLRVKVSERWPDDPAIFRDSGLDLED